jgi:hypothetical protein
VDRRAWLSLVRLGVVVVLISGFVFTSAQLLPSVSDAQKVAQQPGDEDLGAVVDRMVTGRQQAADTYARSGSAAQRRLDRLQGAWETGSVAVRSLTWLQRFTAVLTLVLGVWIIRLIPFWARVLRRRILAISFGAGPE